MHMIFVYDIISIVRSIIAMIYLLFFKISIKNYVQDLFGIKFSRDMRYDTVFTYVILISFLLLN
jgi:hypothetical protein